MNCLPLSRHGAAVALSLLLGLFTGSIRNHASAAELAYLDEAGPPAGGCESCGYCESCSPFNIWYSTLPTPNMIGNFLGGGLRFGFGYDAYSTPAIGGDRIQIAENNSPVPRDRTFFSYNYYDDAYQLSRQNLQRFTFGLEKTFFKGWASAEVRVPFSYGPDRFQTVAPPGAPAAGQNDSFFGNVSVTLKGLALKTPHGGLSGGIGVNAPTGPDFHLFSSAGPSWTVRNDTTTLAPFLAGFITPNRRCFAQAFVYWELPLGKNVVEYSRPILGPFPAQSNAAELKDQRLFHLDTAVGYWLARHPENVWFRGLATMLEFHYTTSLTNGSTFAVADPFLTASGGPGLAQIGNPYNRLDIWNLTLGTFLEIDDFSNLALGWVIPLNTLSGNEQVFEWEFALQLNLRLKPMRR